MQKQKNAVLPEVYAWQGALQSCGSWEEIVPL